MIDARARSSALRSPRFSSLADPRRSCGAVRCAASLRAARECALDAPKLLFLGDLHAMALSPANGGAPHHVRTRACCVPCELQLARKPAIRCKRSARANQSPDLGRSLPFDFLNKFPKSGTQIGFEDGKPCRFGVAEVGRRLQCGPLARERARQKQRNPAPKGPGESEGVTSGRYSIWGSRRVRVGVNRSARSRNGRPAPPEPTQAF